MSPTMRGGSFSGKLRKRHSRAQCSGAAFKGSNAATSLVQCTCGVLEG